MLRSHSLPTGKTLGNPADIEGYVEGRYALAVGASTLKV